MSNCLKFFLAESTDLLRPSLTFILKHNIIIYNISHAPRHQGGRGKLGGRPPPWEIGGTFPWKMLGHNYRGGQL